VAPRCKELKKFVKNPWAYYPVVDVVPNIIVEDCACEVQGLLDGGDLLVSKQQTLAERFVTLLHELLHIEYPSWSEKKVETGAQLLYYNLTENERLVLALVLETRERERHRFYFAYEKEKQAWQEQNCVSNS